MLEKLAKKFLERSEAQAVEEVEELAAIAAQKQAERAAKLAKAHQMLHRNKDERYQDINRALLLSEVILGL